MRQQSRGFTTTSIAGVLALAALAGAVTLAAFVGAMILAAFAGAAPAPVTPASSSPSNPELARAVDAYVRPLVTAGHLSGQLLVARRGEVLLERSFGYANAELKAPVTPSSRFCIASITKPMTVHLAFRLIELRKIAYRDSIAKWIPDFPKGDSITIGLLLQHRSGIPHELVPDSEATRPMTAADMVEIAKRRPLDFPPGARSSYSSGGFTVLARVLEIASGKSYQALLEEHLFGPLGMTQSIHTDGRTMLLGRAQCYVPGERGLENAPYQDLSGLVGAGSVWSTARDIDRFVQAVATGRLGEGMRQSFVRGGKLSFNGRTSGFRAFADWDSASGLEVIFLGNVASGAPDLLKNAIPRLVAGEKIEPAALPQVASQPMPEQKLRRFEGIFQLESGIRLNLRVRGGTLYANDWSLLPMADGGFFSPRDYGIIHGVEGANGRIERLDWLQAGQVYPAPRVGELPAP